MPDLASLCDDLACEHADLDAIVAGLDEAAWQRPTPAEGWTIRDQIAHLAFADQRATLAATDPDAFARLRDADRADSDTWNRRLAGAELAREGAAVLAVWRDERAAFLRAYRTLDPKVRVPWYGPSMSPASKVSARIMETWAHGQDVADALGVVRRPTDRLRHVAFLGVNARRFSYLTNGLAPDDTPIYVELRGPGGDTWTWGEASAADFVRGDALEFCLVVTQRRHRADTALDVHGAAASAWFEIAQAYAGPPGAGRAPSARGVSGP